MPENSCKHDYTHGIGPSPFDPLTATELQNISDYFFANILTNVNIPDDAIFDCVNLVEPPKKKVLKWMKGGHLPKRLVEVPIYYYADDIYHEYIVHLVNEQVSCIQGPKHIKKARPGYTCRDDDKATELVFNDPRFIHAMERRGITDFSTLMANVCTDGRLNSCKCKYDCKGAFGIIDSTHPRPHTFYVNFFNNDGRLGDTSAYTQPIEGVYAIVDMRTNTVLTVVDEEEIIPYQTGNLDWSRPANKKDNTLNPIKYSYTPSYTRNGYQIDWQGWRFHIGFNSISNLSIHNVSFLDRTVWRNDPNADPVRRPLYYKVNIAELITAYSNAKPPANAYNYLDWYDYPARDFVPSIVPGIDVPPYAELLTVPVILADGSVYDLTDAVAIYEVSDGFLWRHFNYPCGDLGTPEIPVEPIYGRSARNLIVQVIPVIANYDYIVYYIFTQDGRLTVRIRASGVMECAGTPVTKVGHHDGEHGEHGGVEAGTLVRENVNAINHRHVACVRFDMMIDGLKTRVYEKEIEFPDINEENPCGNVFKEVEHLLTSEKKAMRDNKFQNGRSWLVESSCSKNYLGHHRSLEIVPSPTMIPTRHPCERIAGRATYFKHNLFVTKYHDGEEYVMGKHPVEKDRDEGLAKYVEDDENIVDENNVVWYQTAFVHSPHTEQYPVMPHEQLEVTVLPHNFFNENPGLYLSDVQDELC
ncbi:copper amine oxidase [Fadolivirus algeromassiliense]|jgi:primary-amine oxidase|uniref:Copper amine oxidase n=1 Tax=Fadolivirus FV1/VV64 TaxID=3070911 RepID=A0A7D3URN2_9VIRU|nr:copper amine oxidase [Fadolivirus algeromassiliense]QKF94813.1 copper amine oxidase [Fadolivirus FV1/VV64]